mgnify:CR=1 FL=1
MTDKLLFITDTYKDLNLKKDTSILMIEEALKNNFLVYQCELSDLFLDQQRVYAPVSYTHLTLPTNREV